MCRVHGNHQKIGRRADRIADLGMRFVVFPPSGSVGSPPSTKEENITVGRILNYKISPYVSVGEAKSGKTFCHIVKCSMRELN